MRRSARPDAWRYHLREMALADEPLRYMRRYLHVEDEISDLDAAESLDTPITPPLSKTAPIPATLALARKAHERREKERHQLELKVVPVIKDPAAKKSNPRLPGSRKST